MKEKCRYHGLKTLEEKRLDRELFPNLMQMCKEDELVFRQKVKDSQGKIRVMVHPYFSDEGGHSEEINSDDIFGYIASLEKLLSVKSNKKIPLVILEEGGSGYLDTQLKLSIQVPEEDLSGVFFVPTCAGESQPIIKYKGCPEYASDMVEDKAWERFDKVLSSCGVKQVIVGGQYMTLSPGEVGWGGDHLNRQYAVKGNKYLVDKTPLQCAGYTAIQLAKNFDVEISNLAYPHRRSVVLGYR